MSERRPHSDLIAHVEHALAGRQRITMSVPGFRHAAVALLLRNRESATFIPLTVRSADLREHSGQVSLPGGVREQSDDSFSMTATRETYEELGIAQDSIRVLGELDDVPTPSKFVITPVVAELAANAQVTPDPNEVADWFEAPLHAFGHPDQAEDMGVREFLGISYCMRAYDVNGHRVWGATARIIEQLVELARHSEPA